MAQRLPFQALPQLTSPLVPESSPPGISGITSPPGASVVSSSLPGASGITSPPAISPLGVTSSPPAISPLGLASSLHGTSLLATDDLNNKPLQVIGRPTSPRDNTKITVQGVNLQRNDLSAISTDNGVKSPSQSSRPLSPRNGVPSLPSLDNKKNEEDVIRPASPNISVENSQENPVIVPSQINFIPPSQTPDNSPAKSQASSPRNASPPSILNLVPGARNLPSGIVPESPQKLPQSSPRESPQKALQPSHRESPQAPPSQQPNPIQGLNMASPRPEIPERQPVKQDETQKNKEEQPKPRQARPSETVQ